MDVLSHGYKMPLRDEMSQYGKNQMFIRSGRNVTARLSQKNIVTKCHSHWLPKIQGVEVPLSDKQTNF
jgi:hypothetical protein